MKSQKEEKTSYGTCTIAEVPDVIIKNQEEGKDTICIFGAQNLSPRMKELLGIKNS